MSSITFLWVNAHNAVLAGSNNEMCNSKKVPPARCPRRFCMVVVFWVYNKKIRRHFLVSFSYCKRIQICWRRKIPLALRICRFPCLYFQMSCHSQDTHTHTPAHTFIHLLLQERMKKDIVWGGGVEEWYREIDEAVRAGVITPCPFPKPDWQTANITQTPGPDRHTAATPTQPTSPTQNAKAEHPNLRPRPNGVWANKFPPCGIIPGGTQRLYWQGKVLSGVRRGFRMEKAQRSCWSSKTLPHDYGHDSLALGDLLREMRPRHSGEVPVFSVMLDVDNLHLGLIVCGSVEYLWQLPEYWVIW